MKSGVNFREWLDSLGCLREYVKARLELGPIYPGTLTLREPLLWITCAFDWDATEEGFYAWSDRADRWEDHLRVKIRLPYAEPGIEIPLGLVDPGMPFNDQLGLALVLAELEDVNEKETCL